MAQVIEKIVRSKYPPRDTRVLWLDSNVNIIKSYGKTGWESTSDIIEKENTEENEFIRPDISGAIKIKHHDLVNLMNLNKLIPGAFYRIIDYEPTIKEEYSHLSVVPNLHKFDICVRAESKNKLSIIAYAASHDDYSDSVFTKGVIFEDSENIYIPKFQGKDYIEYIDAYKNRLQIPKDIELKNGIIIAGRKVKRVFDIFTKDLIFARAAVFIHTYKIEEKKLVQNNIEEFCYAETILPIYSLYDYNTSLYGEWILKSDNVNKKYTNCYLIDNNGNIIYISPIKSIQYKLIKYFDDNILSKWSMFYNIRGSLISELVPSSIEGTFYKWRKYELSKETGEFKRSNVYILTSIRDFNDASIDNTYPIAGMIIEGSSQDYSNYDLKRICYYDKSNNIIKTCDVLNSDYISDYINEVDNEYYVFESEEKFEPDNNYLSKGEITELIDEKGNRCSFDFKNILLFGHYIFTGDRDSHVFDTSIFDFENNGISKKCNISIALEKEYNIGINESTNLILEYPTGNTRIYRSNDSKINSSSFIGICNNSTINNSNIEGILINTRVSNSTIHSLYNKPDIYDSIIEDSNIKILSKIESTYLKNCKIKTSTINNLEGHFHNSIIFNSEFNNLKGYCRVYGIDGATIYAENISTNNPIVAGPNIVPLYLIEKDGNIELVSMAKILNDLYNA